MEIRGLKPSAADLGQRHEEFGGKCLFLTLAEPSISRDLERERWLPKGTHQSSLSNSISRLTVLADFACRRWFSIPHLVLAPVNG